MSSSGVGVFFFGIWADLAMTEPRYQNRIPIDSASDPHLRGIGLVAYSWAVLEGAIERIVWCAGSLREDIAVSITTHTNIQARLDAARTLVNHLYPCTDAAKRLKTLNTHIRHELMGPRNEIVHSRIIGPMFATDHAFMRTIYKARGVLTRDVVPIELDEYETISRDILAAATEALDILTLVEELATESGGAPSP